MGFHKFKASQRIMSQVLSQMVIAIVACGVGVGLGKFVCIGPLHACIFHVQLSVTIWICCQ